MSSNENDVPYGPYGSHGVGVLS